MLPLWQDIFKRKQSEEEVNIRRRTPQLPTTFNPCVNCTTQTSDPKIRLLSVHTQATATFFHVQPKMSARHICRNISSTLAHVWLRHVLEFLILLEGLGQCTGQGNYYFKQECSFVCVCEYFCMCLIVLFCVCCFFVGVCMCVSVCVRACFVCVY